jgi:hypothetical protein
METRSRKRAIVYAVTLRSTIRISDADRAAPYQRDDMRPAARPAALSGSAAPQVRNLIRRVEQRPPAFSDGRDERGSF